MKKEYVVKSPDGYLNREKLIFSEKNYDIFPSLKDARNALEAFEIKVRKNILYRKDKDYALVMDIYINRCTIVDLSEVK